MSQELNIVEKDSNFVNPNKKKKKGVVSSVVCCCFCVQNVYKKNN